MNKLGIKPSQEINLVINEYDLDGDGHINFAEFQQIYMSYQSDNRDAARHPTKWKS